MSMHLTNNALNWIRYLALPHLNVLTTAGMVYFSLLFSRGPLTLNHPTA